MNLKRRLEKLEQWAGVGAKNVCDLPAEKFQKWLVGSTPEERVQVAELLEERIGEPPYRPIEIMSPSEILEELALHNRFFALLHYEDNPETALKLAGEEELSAAEWRGAYAALGLSTEAVPARPETTGPHPDTCPLLVAVRLEEGTDE